MPSARSRLADIEGPELGKPLIEPEIIAARADLITALRLFLKRVDASDQQVADAHAFLADIIADATARPLREIEEGGDE